MSEWIKILISAIAGLLTGIVGGLILEPLKQWYGRKLVARRGRIHIYEEIGNLYQIFCLADSRTDDNFCKHAFKYNPPATYDYYFNEHREACFQMKDWRGIEGFYAFYNVARTVSLEKGDSPGRSVALAASLKNEFDIRFEKKHLDDAVVMKYALVQDRAAPE